MTPVRIGIMGCASIARRRVLPAMAALPAVEITAIASRDPDRAAEVARSYGCRAVAGYRSLLDLDEVEAVYVPLPNALHAPWIEAALATGRHVLAEKPLTTSAARTAELLALARSRRLVLMENMMFLHHSQHAVVRQHVADGAIGSLRSFHAAFGVPRRPADDVRHQPELGGGALLDTGVYPVRAALSFLGDRRLDVLSAVLTSRHGQLVDSCGQALLDTDDGVGAQLAFGLDNLYRSSYQLWGSEGRIVVEHAYSPPADHVPVLRLERHSGVQEFRLEPDDQVTNAVRAFATAVRSGQLPDDRDVLRQAVLVEEIGTRARRHVDHTPDPAATGPLERLS
ncbi:Gfo/Idh/MocA family oxidoreductase [Micromonospora sp. WMMD987]|uniref:Gfo/Idh/MocA family protein n=1 Tax=Micromonospora TaxID=1873 RepID=UPI00249A2BDF|nr:Gfo/Idh/MocA family oxidoreductase [Micromonospora sp. WMMD987]WFE93430.1 Gfo/Idh/MocA family oxidoreductase [Micromonospora sp. WMMD987]